MISQMRIRACHLCHGSVFKLIDDSGTYVWCIDCGGYGKKAVAHNKVYKPEESKLENESETWS